MPQPIVDSILPNFKGMMMGYNTIALKKENGVSLITLNRPKAMNAINDEMRLELGDAIKEVETDDDTRVLIITGSGNAFSAGADLNEFNDSHSQFRQSGRKAEFGGPDLALQFARFPKPLIAAINGVAVGWGMTMPVACDIRLASPNARFAAPFVRVGLTPEFGSCYLLQRLIGYGPAADLFFSARMVDANEALAIGLVNRIVRHEHLLSEAWSLAHAIAAHPRAALLRTKELLRRGMLDRPLQEWIEYEASVFQECMTGSEHHEAVLNLLAELARKDKKAD
jgi:enoyl-CoA hydratase/carnithine racemase